MSDFSFNFIFMINIITNPLLLGIIQEVLDYQDLDYREFTIPGLIKYSIYSSNSSNSSIIGIVVTKLLGKFFGPSHTDNGGPPVHVINVIRIYAEKLKYPCLISLETK